MSYAVFCADIGTSSLKAAIISSTGDILCTDTENFNKKLGSNRWYTALASSCNLMLNNLLLKAASESLSKKADSDAKGSDSTRAGVMPGRKSAQPIVTPMWEKDCIKDLFRPEIFTKLPVIKAISISGNGPSLANSGGSFLWNEPFDPGEVAAELASSPDQHSIYVPRLIHIKHRMPEMWDCGEKIFSVPEYTVFQMTGTSLTMLPEERFQMAYWKQQDLLNFGLPEEKLPRLRIPGKSAGTLKKELAADFGLAMNPLQTNMPEVFCGGPDFTIALIGTGTISPGCVCDRAGTSEGINICTARPFSVKGIRTLPSPQAPYWNESVLLPDSGARFNTWKKLNLFDELPDEECTEYILKHPESDGYALLLRIAAEVKNGYKFLYANAAKNGTKPAAEVASTGGQAKNRLWMQMKADVTGISFKVPECPDAELLGNACVALAGIKEYSSIKYAASAIIKYRTFYRPDAVRNRKYMEFLSKARTL
ncbi:MAG: hypothetical protein K5751_09065 [Treponemataceae bacterium]|nr:hypothetical protein [Treponemataceae bacterium]